MTTTALQPFSTCSFCLRDYAPTDLLPLGEEISASGQLHHSWICQKCDARLNELGALDEQNPPAWVSACQASSRLWAESADWRLNALLATGYPESERLMRELARRACGGSQGEAAL